MIEQARQAIALAEAGNSDWEKVEALWSEVRAKHPRIFSAKDLGTMVGPGWWTLLNEALTKIDAVLDEHPGTTFAVVQIKEKFGGLRVYGDADVGDTGVEIYPQIDVIIEGAEKQAATTCEECGEPGEPRYSGWVKVLCDRHDAERKKKHGLPTD